MKQPDCLVKVFRLFLWQRGDEVKCRSEVILPVIPLLLCNIFINGCTPGKGEKSSVSDVPRAGLQRVDKETCLETDSGRMWQVARSRPFSSPREAEEYARSLESGGYNDWRLPTRDELFFLYSLFFWKKNGDCRMNRKGDYWAAKEEGKSSPGHWETYYLCGPEHTYVESMTAKGSVRAVRP